MDSIYFIILLIWMLMLVISIFKAYKGKYQSYFVRRSRGCTVRKILKDEDKLNEKVKKVIVQADVIELVFIMGISISLYYGFLYPAIGLGILLIANGLLTDHYIVKQTGNS